MTRSSIRAVLGAAALLATLVAPVSAQGPFASEPEAPTAGPQVPDLQRRSLAGTGPVAPALGARPALPRAARAHPKLDAAMAEIADAVAVGVARLTGLGSESGLRLDGGRVQTIVTATAPSRTATATPSTSSPVLVIRTPRSEPQ